ncbi:TerC family protein [Thioalkalivibrio sp. HK1]|uniref:TerC family protein n=1 Tax=Thioalkalivibrio sp. HK1 TaxID=1469245 RepID=UPI0004BA2D9C|nr:TerC family protein [Thioalkalivibrio sp. HK1]
MDILFSIVSPAEFSALFQVILVDLVLAGDNAIVIGMAAAGLPREYRAKVIFFGIAAATVMRIGFAAITVQLLQITGLLLIGGLLLVWVAWKLWVELRTPHAKPSIDDPSLEQSEAKRQASPKQVRQAVLSILIADVSMSLDNVLAVAGIARDSTWILVTGLVLSVALMGFAASWIARLLDRHRWIAYIGLITIVYVAGVMVYDGGQELLCAFEYIECQAPPAAGG